MTCQRAVSVALLVDLGHEFFKGERSHQAGHLYSSRRWRVRAAKGARLESACGGNLTVGSNPTATAIFIRGIWEEATQVADGSHRHRHIFRGICQSGLTLFG